MKKLLLLLVFLCCFSVACIAQEDTAKSDTPQIDITRLKLHLVNVKTGNNITGLPVKIEARHLISGAVEKETMISDAQGFIMYTLTPGNWEITLAADNQSTDVIDYYSEIKVYIQVDEPELQKKSFMRPVGTIEGVVYDAADNLISNAEIGLICAKEKEAASTTNKFGAFRVKYLPVGQCTVSAAFEDAVGSKKVWVDKGELATISIKLDKSIANSSINIWYFILIAAIAAIIVGGFILYRTRKTRGITIETNSSSEATEEPGMEVSYDVEGEEPKTSEMLNPRARDVMETLNEKEKKIVKFIMSEGNHSTQASIRNGTGIPKTSLARDIKSLESKKVVAIERIGKMKKIDLTDWFLGKE